MFFIIRNTNKILYNKISLNLWPSSSSYFKSNKHTDDNANILKSNEPVDHIDIIPEFCSHIFILGKISSQHTSGLVDYSVKKYL